MDAIRCIFLGLNENDPLCYIAQLSKEVLKEGEKFVEMYQKNHDFLCGQTLRRVPFLVRESGQSSFDLNLYPLVFVGSKQEKESTSLVSKSGDGLLTPIKRNASLTNKYVSVDDSAKETPEAAKSKIKSSDMREQTVDPAATKRKLFVSSTTFASALRTINPDEKNKVFISTDSAARTTTPNVAETFTGVEMLISATSGKMVTSSDAANRNVDSDEPIKFPHVEVQADIYADVEEKSDSSNQITEMLRNKNTEQQESLNPSVNIITDENRKRKMKRTKLYCCPRTDIQSFVSSNKKAVMNILLSQRAERMGIPSTSNEVNISPIVKKKEIANLEEKKDYPSPSLHKYVFKERPRIVSSNGIELLDIVLPCELHVIPSPDIPSIPRDYSLDAKRSSTKDIGRDVFDKSKDGSSPKNYQHHSSPSGMITGKTNIPAENKGCILRKKLSPSARPPKALSSETLEPKASSLENKIFVCSPQSSKETDSSVTDSDGIRRKRVSPSVGASKDTMPQKSLKLESSHSEKKKCIASPQRGVKESSPRKIKSFQSQIPTSATPLKAATSAENPSANNASFNDTSHLDANIINWFKNNLTNFISNREVDTYQTFQSYLEFRNELICLLLYVKKIAYIAEIIPTERKGQEDITLDLQSLLNDLAATASNLSIELNMWKRIGDSQIQIFNKVCEEIIARKYRLETSSNAIITAVETMNFLQTCEMDLRSLWEKITLIKNEEKKGRLLFLKSQLLLMKLMTQFYSCLSIIGIVKIQSDTSSA